MTRPFHQVDVFASRPTEGNPVAVVHDADDLDDARMQRLAAWTNLSETTFLLAPTDPGADYRLRIFTPSRELPFAGHPTLGSARAWREAHPEAADRDTLVQQCGAGLVRLRRLDGRWAFAAPTPVREGPVDDADVDTLCAYLAISRDRVVDAHWVDNGPGWVALLLDAAATVLALRPTGPPPPGLAEIGVVGPHPEPADPAVDPRFEVRAFVTRAGGVDEDPVTGSLNAGLARWLVASGRAPVVYVAAQGTVLGRRGRVHVRAVDGDRWIGGDTGVVVSGHLDLAAGGQP